MAGIQYFPIAIVFLYIIVISKLSFIASESSGFSLRLIPRDSLESPLYPGNLTKFERIERLIGFSNAKAELMKLRSPPNATFGDEKFSTPLKRQIYYYIAEMKLGKPPQTVYLLVDTGGGLLWTQCQPCLNCFNQEDPIYDPRVSLTYQKLSCEDPRCNYHDEQSVFKCVNDECVYEIYYGAGDMDPTIGFGSMESFHFRSGMDGNTTELNLLFGCSFYRTNFDSFAIPNNKISGIFGLNLSPESISTQLYQSNGGIFSYCVVPFDNDFGMHSHILRFGNDVVLPARHIPTTNYFTFHRHYYYYLNCIDISIGNLHLQLPDGTFDATLDSGFIIDSGASFTVLTTQATNGINVYQWVLTQLMNYYDYYQFVRIPDSRAVVGFDLCYFNQQGFKNFPSMTFHFQRADYVIDGRYLNIYLQEHGIFCAAILGKPGYSMLGAFHMQDMRIIHDGHRQTIQFYPANCADDFL